MKRSAKCFRAWLWRKAAKGAKDHDIETGLRAIFLGDFVSSHIIRHGYYERRELEALARSVFTGPGGAGSGSTALDIGANIGNHAAFLSNHFSRVIAFEPNPMVACLLKANAMALGGGGGSIRSCRDGSFRFKHDAQFLGQRKESRRLFGRGGGHRIDD